MKSLVPLNTTDYSTVIGQLMASPCDTVVGTMYGGGFIAFVKAGGAIRIVQDEEKLLWGANTGDYAVAKALGLEFPGRGLGRGLRHLVLRRLRRPREISGGVGAAPGTQGD